MKALNSIVASGSANYLLLFCVPFQDFVINWEI